MQSKNPKSKVEKTTMVDVDAVAKKRGLNKPSNWGKFPDPKLFSETPGMSRKSCLTGVTLSQMVYAVKRYCNVRCAMWIEITPELAQLILEEFNVRNRDMDKGLQEELIAAMISNTFYSTSNTIKFDGKCLAIDGQNRLAAIVASRESQIMLVSFGELPELAQLSTDLGRVRTAVQHGGMFGDPTAEEIYVARHMFQLSPNFSGGTGVGRKMSTPEVTEAYKAYHQSIERACSMFVRRKKSVPVTIKAVIARAYQSAPVKAVDRFCKILDGGFDGMTQSTHESVVRTFMDEVEPLAAMRSWPKYAVIYRMTEQALMHFIKQETPTEIKQSYKELFRVKNSSIGMAMEQSRIAFARQKFILLTDTPCGRLALADSEEARAAAAVSVEA